MAVNVTHEFKACDDEKAVNSDKEAIICVGSTGTGKSSLIRLYCGNSVIVGHHTHSQTTKSTLFKQTNSNKKYWLDSQGANDSNGCDDKKVLTDILKKLYDEQITNVKVIWCVSGDMCREKKEFQTQAQFIKSLGDNVWKSCLILKKKGKPQPKRIKGVLAAANRYGANIQKDDKHRLFGFKGLEYGNNVDDDEEDDLLEEINEEEDEAIRRAKYKKYGYFTDQQIVTEVNQKLTALPSLRVEFEIKQCIKCGIKGDPRFVFAPCHPRSESYHPQPIIQYHDGELAHVHIGVLRQVAIQNIEWFHPHALQVPSKPTKPRRALGIAFLIASEMTEQQWKEMHGTYPCCNKGYFGSGCNSRFTTSGYESKWSCCEQSPSATGCKQQYQCCDGTRRSPGCKRKYECCDRNEGHTGCKKRCQLCHTEWNQGPGCVATD